MNALDDGGVNTARDPMMYKDFCDDVRWLTKG